MKQEVEVRQDFILLIYFFKLTYSCKFQNQDLKKYLIGLPDGSVVKNLPANAGDPGSIPGSGRPLEKEMATHSSTLA